MKNKTISLTAAFFVISCVSAFAWGEQDSSPSIKNGVRVIGDYEFADNQLKNINIPDSVISIGEGAFAKNPLTRVNIPKNVSSMVNGRSRNANPFSMIPSLEFVSVDPMNSYFTSIDGVLYSKDKSILFAYPSVKGNVYTIPNGVTEIASRAFTGTQIGSISLPNGLVIIGEGAFMSANLTSVIIPNSVNEIGSHAFFQNNLTNVTISTNITSIEWWTFYGNQLTSVIIPGNVNSIGFMAFTGNQLTSITIGANVSLGSYVIDDDEYSGDAFDNGFDDFYNRNGKRDGTYTYTNGRWNRR